MSNKTMLEEFMELLDELEPTMGTLINVEARVEDVYPIKVEGMYTDRYITITFAEKKVEIRLEHDKYGTEELDILTYSLPNETECTTEHHDMFLDLMEVRDITIEDISDDIYHLRYMVLSKEIDRKNVTDYDIEYLVDALKELKEAKGDEWVTVTV